MTVDEEIDAACAHDREGRGRGHEFGVEPALES